MRYGSTEAFRTAETGALSVSVWKTINCHAIVWSWAEESFKFGGLRQQRPDGRMSEAELGTTRSPRETDRRHCRPTAELTGWHSSIRYSGAAPTKQWQTIRTILKSILLLIGSQWSSSRMAADMWDVQDQPSGRVQQLWKMPCTKAGKFLLLETQIRTRATNT